MAVSLQGLMVVEHLDEGHVRAILIVEYPNLLVVHLAESLQSIVQWQRAMSDFLHHRLQ